MSLFLIFLPRLQVKPLFWLDLQHFFNFFENPVKTLRDDPQTPSKASRINPKIFDFLTPEAEGRPFFDWS